MAITSKSTKAEILGAYDAIKGLQAQQQKELDDFKKNVVKVATQYARDHDWCDVVNDALEEMGLKVAGRITLKMEVVFDNLPPSKVENALSLDLEYIEATGSAAGVDVYDFQQLLAEECPSATITDAKFEVV